MQSLRRASTISTAVPKESSERLIQLPLPWHDTVPASSPTLCPVSTSERWDFEYHDEEPYNLADLVDDITHSDISEKRPSRINTENVTRKLPLLRTTGLIISPSAVEKDDQLHDPALSGPHVHVSPLHNKRGIVNCIGMVMIVVGMAMILIGLPAISRVKEVDHIRTLCDEDPMCIRSDLPLLKNARHGPIDPDTPSSVMTRIDTYGHLQNLVFSDEFQKEGRSFYDGDDPYFSGVNIWYGVTADLEWYDPDAISTANGTLNIRFDAFKNHNLNFRSGMLQSWNKLCFTGGYVEASISLPGSGEVPGLWFVGQVQTLLASMLTSSLGLVSGRWVI